MNADLNGDIVWKTNIMNNYYAGYSSSVQFINEKIIIANYHVCFELNSKTGELITTGERVNYVHQ